MGLFLQQLQLLQQLYKLHYDLLIVYQTFSKLITSASVSSCQVRLLMVKLVCNSSVTSGFNALYQWVVGCNQTFDLRWLFSIVNSGNDYYLTLLSNPGISHHQAVRNQGQIGPKMANFLDKLTVFAFVGNPTVGLGQGTQPFRYFRSHCAYFYELRPPMSSRCIYFFTLLLFCFRTQSLLSILIQETKSLQ